MVNVTHPGPNDPPGQPPIVDPPEAPTINPPGPPTIDPPHPPEIDPPRPPEVTPPAPPTIDPPEPPIIIESRADAPEPADKEEAPEGLPIPHDPVHPEIPPMPGSLN
ncbi:MAG: hypothetical protein GC204_07425 [Chloroflexi bacterium]|nr:hypothetical protein [Chloroflexota bacterium]